MKVNVYMVIDLSQYLNTYEREIERKKKKLIEANNTR